MAGNPFTPTFGTSPPLLVGRDRELDEFREALDDGVGAPGRAMLLTGARGSGKTVLLNALEDEARARGWVVISESTRPGIVAELTNSALPELLQRYDPNAVDSRVSAANATAAGIGAGMTRQITERHEVTPRLRTQVEQLTTLLADQGSGLLITMDEVHRDATDDLRQLTQVVQHAFREGRELAFAAAGLPSAVQGILSDHVITFLRRAERFSLGAVNPGDVAHALRDPIEVAGRNIGDDALAHAVNGTRGYPFLVQLVGRQIWNVDRQSERITLEHAHRGVQNSIRRIGRLVHEPALAELSDIDRSFLAAMAVDEGPSRMNDIAARLHVESSYAGQYRLRLIAAEVIQPSGHGLVDFTLPYLRDHLRHHVASLAFNQTAITDARPVQPDPGPDAATSAQHLPERSRTDPDRRR